MDLLNALNDPNADLPGGWQGYDNIVTAIESGFLERLTVSDWNTLINYIASDEVKLNAICSLAREDIPNGEFAANNNTNCPDEVPVPSELFFLSILSFLFIYYYHNREEFSIFRFFKKSNE